MMKGILKMVENTQSYKDLQNDYECQCEENGKKQDKINKQKKRIEELEKKVEELTLKLKASDKEYDRLLQSLSKDKFEEEVNDKDRKSKKSFNRK